MPFFFPSQLAGVVKLTKRYIDVVRKAKKYKRNIYYLERAIRTYRKDYNKLEHEYIDLNYRLRQHESKEIIMFLNRLLANVESTRYHTRNGPISMLTKDFEIRNSLLEEAKEKGWL